MKFWPLYFLSLLVLTPYQVERFGYEAERIEGIRFIGKHKAEIQKICHEMGQPASKILPIVFPELIRYSLFRDFLETKMLERHYIKEGLEGADFSIGPFQMKPSFAEKIEAAIKGTQIEIAWFIKEQQTQEDTRKARLNRLSSLEGQLRYACAFVTIMDQRMTTETFVHEEDRIRFYAAAYNYGFDRPITEIQQWMPVEAFPFGLQFEAQQYAYADLAVDYYLRANR